MFSFISKIIKFTFFMILLTPVASFFAFKHLYPKQYKSASKAVHLCMAGVMQQANTQSHNKLAEFVAAAPDKSQKGMMKYLGLNFNKFIGFFDFSEYKIKPIAFAEGSQQVALNVSRSGAEQYIFQQGDQKFVLIGRQFYAYQASNTYAVQGKQISYVPGATVVPLPPVATPPVAAPSVVTPQQVAAQPAPPDSAAQASKIATPPVATPPAATPPAATPPVPQSKGAKKGKVVPATPMLNKYLPQRSALQKARQVKKQYEQKVMKKLPSVQPNLPTKPVAPTKPDASILDEIDALE